MPSAARPRARFTISARSSATRRTTDGCSADQHLIVRSPALLSHCAQATSSFGHKWGHGNRSRSAEAKPAIHRASLVHLSLHSLGKQLAVSWLETFLSVGLASSSLRTIFRKATA